MPRLKPRRSAVSVMKKPGDNYLSVESFQPELENRSGIDRNLMSDLEDSRVRAN